MDCKLYCSKNLDALDVNNLTDVERARLGFAQAEQPLP